MGIQHAIGEYTKTVSSVPPQLTVTAGGASNNVAVNGVSVDRMNYLSMVVAVAYQCTLSSTKTLTITIAIQHSEDNATWTAYGTQPANQVISASTANAIFTQNVDLHAANRYVRLVITPNLSNTGTDTASVAGLLVLGGANELPAT